MLQANIDAAINAIEADPKVQFCMTGREVQGMKLTDAEGKSTRTRIGDKSAARFPELTKQMRSIIATSALKKAKDNYYKKYDELNEKMLQDYAKMGERMAEIPRRELARRACISFAETSSLPKSPEPPKTDFAKISTAIMVAGAVAMIPFTGGASFAILATALSIGAAALGAGGITGLATAGKANGEDSKIEQELIGSKTLNQWNYKETITSTFEWETLKCEKCVRSQNCAKTKRPLFGKPWCKDWGEEKNECTTTQF